MTKTDRRVQRTQAQLQKTLIALVRERDYDALTIQDIVDRANVGRTTFYLHYRSKDDLFMSCHKAIANGFHSDSESPASQHFSREELLSLEVSPAMRAAFQHLEAVWRELSTVFHGKDGSLILRQIRDQRAQEIEENLRDVFVNVDSLIPLDVLANYLSGSQLALIQWCLEKRQPHTAEQLAQMHHRLQRAAICEAFGLENGK